MKALFLVSIIFCIQTRKCARLFTENITEYLAHAQAVCTRPLLGGGGGVGNEVMVLCVACVIRCDITCFIFQLELCCLGNTTV